MRSLVAKVLKKVSGEKFSKIFFPSTIFQKVKFQQFEPRKNRDQGGFKMVP